MAIFQTVSPFDIESIADRMGRGSSFTSEGWRIIGEYIEEAGEDVELDIIALCCEFEEANSIAEFADQYPDVIEDAEEWAEKEDGEKLEAIREYLENNTTVVHCEEDCIIFIEF